MFTIHYCEAELATRFMKQARDGEKRSDSDAKEKFEGKELDRQTIGNSE